MAGLTDGQTSFLLIGVTFLALMTVFNGLFIGQELKDANVDSMSITDVLGKSWAIFTQPELIIANFILGIISLTAGVIITASWVRG